MNQSPKEPMAAKQDSSLSLYTYITMTCIVILVGLIYGHTYRFDYLRSDIPLIVFENRHINTGLLPENILWAFTTKNSSLYQALPSITFMLDSDLFGKWPGGYNLVTAAWHATCMCLFFWVMLRLTKQFAPVLAATLFMCVHPLHLLTVAQIAPRNEILQAVFLLLSIEAYRRYVTEHSRKTYLFSLVFMTLGLLCKQMIVMLPVIMLFLDYWPLGRITLSWRTLAETFSRGFILVLEKTPFFALSIVGILLAFWGKSEVLTFGNVESMTLSKTAYAVVTGYARYVGHWAYPLQVGYYFRDSETLSVWLFVGSLILLAAVTIIALLLIIRRPYIFVGWMWFVVFIFPVSGIVGYMVESISLRYMYVSSMGLFLALAFGLHDLLHFQRSRETKTTAKINTSRVFWVLTCTLTMVLASLCFWQSFFFRDTESIAHRMLDITDGHHATANNWLADSYFRQGQNKLAMEYIMKAIKIAPDNPHYKSVLASFLFNRKLYRESLTVAEAALQQHQDYCELLHLCAKALMALQKFDKAEPYFYSALEKEPENILVMHNLAYCLALQKKYDEARFYNDKSLEIAPDYDLAKKLKLELDKFAPRH